MQFSSYGYRILNIGYISIPAHLLSPSFLQHGLYALPSCFDSMYVGAMTLLKKYVSLIIFVHSLNCHECQYRHNSP